MYPFPPKGRRALFIVHDPKLHAWTLRIGYQNGSSDQPDGRRPYRGMLPDVDFARLVPDPNHRSLFRRILDLIRRERGSREPESNSDASVSGLSAGRVGKTVFAPYVGVQRSRRFGFGTGIASQGSRGLTGRPENN